MTLRIGRFSLCPDFDKVWDFYRFVSGSSKTGASTTRPPITSLLDWDLVDWLLFPA